MDGAEVKLKLHGRAHKASVKLAENTQVSIFPSEYPPWHKMPGFYIPCLAQSVHMTED